MDLSVLSFGHVNMYTQWCSITHSLATTLKQLIPSGLPNSLLGTLSSSTHVDFNLIQSTHPSIVARKHCHSCWCNTHLSFPITTPIISNLSLPPHRCKRPWYLLEGLPRHISTANLACYACASVAKFSSLIVMTHKARPDHKCLLPSNPWDCFDKHSLSICIRPLSFWCR